MMPAMAAGMEFSTMPRAPMIAARITRVSRVVRVEVRSRMYPIKGIEMRPPRGRARSKSLFT